MPDLPIAESTQALKRQIDELRQQQSRAVRSAIYVGMSRKEQNDYDERQTQIAELLRRLKALEESVDGAPAPLIPHSL
jgi:lipid II:glycine glycyltransferase (peptidoglycan interpeptide bridge formation enzyme)